MLCEKEPRCKTMVLGQMLAWFFCFSEICEEVPIFRLKFRWFKVVFLCLWNNEGTCITLDLVAVYEDMNLALLKFRTIVLKSEQEILK